MNNCKKCGTPFDENDKFCVTCGTKREPEEEKVIDEKIIIDSLQNKSYENLQVSKESEANIQSKNAEQAKLKVETAQINKNEEIKENLKHNTISQGKINKTLKNNSTEEENIDEEYEENEGNNRSFSLILLILFILGFVGSYLFFISSHTQSSGSSTEISNNSTMNSQNVDSSSNNVKNDNLKNKDNNVKANNKSNEYILPYSNVKPLELNSIKNMSKEKLALARNEIFARHGYVFKGEPYESYFNSKSWYKSDPKFTGEGKQLSPLERHNIKIIMTAEGLEKNLAPNYDADYKGK